MCLQHGIGCLTHTNLSCKFSLRSEERLGGAAAAVKELQNKNIPILNNRSTEIVVLCCVVFMFIVIPYDYKKSSHTALLCQVIILKCKKKTKKPND